MLTDARIDEIMTPLTQGVPYSWRKFARAIEAEVCSAQNAESERQDGLSLTGATQKPCPTCEGRANGSLVAMPITALKALQAKVAELEAEAAENCRIIGMSSEREARHLAAISELERECNGLAARIGKELNVENEALKVSVSEQAALIEKCEKAIIDALKTTYSDKLASDFRNVLAAIAAQKGGAA